MLGSYLGRHGIGRRVGSARVEVFLCGHNVRTGQVLTVEEWVQRGFSGMKGLGLMGRADAEWVSGQALQGLRTGWWAS